MLNKMLTKLKETKLNIKLFYYDKPPMMGCKIKVGI